MAGWFDGFREPGGITYYEDFRTPVTSDVTFYAVVTICAIVGLAFFIVAVGTRGKGRWKTFIKVLFSLHIGVVLLICITGQDWQTAYVRADCEYLFAKPGGSGKISAEIGLKVGLQSVNVTLTVPVNKNNSHSGLYYNERFWYIGVREMEDSYIDSLERGLPQPILYIAEYFSADAGGLRWLRGFRNSGYIAYILLWTSFSFWVVFNVLICIEVFLGACLLGLTGALMVLSVILYTVLQPTHAFVIPFEEDKYIRLNFDWCFWAVLGSGVLTLVVGSVIAIMDSWFHAEMSSFFMVEALEEEEDEPDAAYLKAPLHYDDEVPRKPSQTRLSFYVNSGYEGEPNEPAQEIRNRVNGSAVESDVRISMVGPEDVSRR